jgi:hypothetical protein
MKPRFRDLTGQVFGWLTATKRIGTSGLWKCECWCGKITSAKADRLLGGHIKSCGCLLSYNGFKMARKNFNKMEVI